MFFSQRRRRNLFLVAQFSASVEVVPDVDGARLSTNHIIMVQMKNWTRMGQRLLNSPVHSWYRTSYFNRKLMWGHQAFICISLQLAYERLFRNSIFNNTTAAVVLSTLLSVCSVYHFISSVRFAILISQSVANLDLQTVDIHVLWLISYLPITHHWWLARRFQLPKQYAFVLDDGILFRICFLFYLFSQVFPPGKVNQPTCGV